MKNLIILLSCMIICSTLSSMPSEAQTNSEPPIDTHILEYYKQAGRGSIVGNLAFRAYDAYEVIPQNVRVFFIPGLEYTRAYIRKYRKSLINYAYAVYRNTNEEGTELHLEDLDPRIFSVVKSTTTDQKGSFQIHNLQPGWYYLLSEWRASSTYLKTTYRKEYYPTRKLYPFDPDCVGTPDEQREWYGTFLDCDEDDSPHTIIRQVLTPHHAYYLVMMIPSNPIIVKNDQTAILPEVSLTQICATKFCDEFKHNQWFDDAARAIEIPMIKP